MNMIIQTNKTRGYMGTQRLLDYAKALANEKGLSFDKSDICFTQEDFIKKINMKENCIIIFDAARLGMSEMAFKLNKKSNIKMIWKPHEYGYGSTCVIDDGLLLTVNKSMTKDVWYGCIFNNAKCITTKSEKEAKELCEIGAKNILERAYQKMCE